MNLERVRTLFLRDVGRFCRVPEVLSALGTSSAERDVVLEALVKTGEGEAALFAAMVLAADGNRAGLELLRQPQRAYVTNSAIEQGLSLVARVLLGDVTLTEPFINCTMVSELATELGIWPPAPRRL